MGRGMHRAIIDCVLHPHMQSLMMTIDSFPFGIVHVIYAVAKLFPPGFHRHRLRSQHEARGLQNHSGDAFLT